MEVNTISLSNVLKEMDNGKPFDIEYVTCDTTRGTGGAVRTAKNVVLVNKRNKKRPAQVDGMSEEEYAIKEAVKKSPNHHENSTKNIYDTKKPAKKGRITKVHLRLILSFNGLTVT